MSFPTLRIRAYHAPSGSVITGVVTDMLYEKDQHPSYRVIPDGLLESVVIRAGVWHVTELREAAGVIS